jgi:DNA processing protein
VLSTRELLIALNASEDLHRVAVCRLAQEPERWCRNAEPGLAYRLGIPSRTLAKVRRLIPLAARRAAEVEEEAATLGARLITLLDDDYPPTLRDLRLPPPVLSVRGDASALVAPAVAMVGSRKATTYGLQIAHRLAHDLAGHGMVVVSGFAQGIDAACHRGALDAGGRTVAVLGCGQAVSYPNHHRSLGDAIVAQGALVSELPLHHPPRPWCFPMRNRVIAALTAGTLVVQGEKRSGSLITAHHALDLGREVWAVPGRAGDPRTAGPHGLIRDGAPLVEEAQDILETLHLPRNLTLDFPVSAPEAALETTDCSPGAGRREVRTEPRGTAGKVLKLLPAGMERTPDELSSVSGIGVEALLGELLELELAGWLERLPGPVYRRL